MARRNQPGIIVQGDRRFVEFTLTEVGVMTRRQELVADGPTFLDDLQQRCGQMPAFHREPVRDLRDEPDELPRK